MKIQRLTDDNHNKAAALLRQAFPNSRYEERLFNNLHKKGRTVYEWVCIHTNRYIAYIAFTKAYRGNDVCGLHLAPLAVNPEFQHQGIGSELLRFALRQKEVKDTTIYVLGAPKFYERFGFVRCDQPKCPFDPGNKHFLALRNDPHQHFTVGYEPEF
ncbi:GNAT family N-acetyltransferase [Desulfopila aestuarii]|uniref:Putative acetyltransferase n=1 Tax=Desulfopila aestuarii DSM 18488 TaxID=1121416 RepID=A0A1M7XZS3_9BACT|nr:N-acetyltransferase [Desulfopila aestuarii]SHO44688.1 putative acetyltransferase [Desulfopila aestuarii DSM 18488]